MATAMANEQLPVEGNGSYGRFTGPAGPSEASLNGDRRLIAVTLGGKSDFVIKCYPEPTNKIFRKRRYHRVVDLSPKDWRLAGRETVLGGACAMFYELVITYQPTMQYAIANVTHLLKGAHQHIESQHEPIVRDIVRKCLDTSNESLLFGDADVARVASSVSLRTEIETRIVKRLATCEIQVSGAKCDLSFDQASIARLNKDRTGDQDKPTEAIFGDWRALYRRIERTHGQYRLDMQNERLLIREKQKKDGAEHLERLAAFDEAEKLEIKAQRNREKDLEKFELDLQKKDAEWQADIAIKRKTEDRRVIREDEVYAIAAFEDHAKFVGLGVDEARLDLAKTEAENAVELAVARRNKSREELQIDVEERRMRAEAAVDIEKRRETLNGLAAILEKVVQGFPELKNVNLLQLSGSAGVADGSTRDAFSGMSATGALVGNLVYLRELIKFIGTIESDRH